jgi:cytochrome c-type biogenesis protein CcmH
MSLFWVISAALLLLALWMVLGTLWRRPAHAGAVQSASQSNLAVLKAQLQQIDHDLAQGAIDATQHRASRAEIERRVLEEENVAAAPVRQGSPFNTMLMLAVAVPVLALGLYAQIGTPDALSPQAMAPQGAPSSHEVESMVTKLAERMEKQPPGNVADTEGWVMLGRSYAVMQRYAEASRAFGRALQLMPNDAQIMVDQADVLAMQQGGNLEGEPLRLVERALQNSPSNLKGLALAGTAAFERKDYAGAIGYWTRARATAPPDSDFARGLEQSIADARAAAGSGAAPASPVVSTAPATVAAPAAPAKAAGPASISGRVSLSPALAARVAPGDTLFVFARAAEGPRMPLAIVKRTAADLPLSFTLDDSMAMAPDFKLSSFANVVVGARLSKSSNATPQSGDLEGQSAALAGRSSGIEIVIDSVRP